MKINFTGTTNTAKYNQQVYTLYHDEQNRPFIMNDHYIKINNLNTELTDDNDGNDLSEYKLRLQNSAIPNAINNIYSHYLNISTVQPNMNKNELYLFINGEPLDIKDENLSLLSFISKILKQIINKPNEKFDITEDYINDANNRMAVVYGEDIYDELEKEDNYIDKVNEMHNPENIKATASEIISIITEKMMDYFS